MKSLTVILAGTLIAAAGFTATPSEARPGSLSAAGRSHHGGHGPSGGGLSAVHRRAPSHISPHIGLPGISGFSTSPRISPHIGLPGISGFPVGDTSRRRRGHHGGHERDFEFVDLGYWGDGDGYVDTIPTRDQ